MGAETRAGYVALVGRPNVGKSTLLNALVGEKLSIVTPRAQTTRDRVMGIATTEQAQVVFVDTPGLLAPSYLLHRSMLSAALAAVEDADLVLLLLDGTDPEATPAPDVVALLRRRRDSLFVAINKLDEAPAEAIDALARWSEEQFGIEPLRISAATGEGVEPLRDTLLGALPESPFLYPEDDLAVQPVRFFVSEMIRETIFEEYREEVPYSTAVRIEEFRENADPIVIRATIYVERDSQKVILIGRGGEGIKRLGQRAREKVEAFLGARIFLELWVKVLPRWRKSRHALEQLGYPPPPEEGAPSRGRGRGPGGRRPSGGQPRDQKRKRS
jgi:GTP-binding protein Era